MSLETCVKPIPKPSFFILNIHKLILQRQKQPLTHKTIGFLQKGEQGQTQPDQAKQSQAMSLQSLEISILRTGISKETHYMLLLSQTRPVKTSCAFQLPLLALGLLGKGGSTAWKVSKLIGKGSFNQIWRICAFQRPLQALDLLGKGGEYCLEGVQAYRERVI